MKKYLLLFILPLCWLAACDTKEDREDMPRPAYTSKDLQYSITQQAGYDNRVMLENKTPGVLPYWDYIVGVSNKQKDTIVLPFAGDFFIKFYAYTKGGPVVDSTRITVTNNDPNYFHNPAWNFLTNGVAGKTWVWAADVPTGFCFGNGSGAATTPEWWQVPASQLGDAVADEMHFDLDGAYNYTITHNGVTSKGLFALDTTAMSLKITGADIPKGNGVTYNIVTLNDNELTIVQQGDGWRDLWLFKRKGYNY